jgi:NAD(P)H-nitrite reductase large subunit
MDGKQHVIIGGSAAGMAAAEAIRRHDPDGSVLVLSEEIDPPYYRPMIPFLISGRKKAGEIGLQGQGPYRSSAITIRLATRAARIDTRAMHVVTDSGESIPYDRLLIATGSRPRIPAAIDGLKSDGVFALRTLADARRAAERAKSTSRAVMLGGGLLNLKTAFALLERGIKVTLAVYSPEVLSQLMEPADAFLLRQALDQAGLTILTGCSAGQIVCDRDGVRAVALDNGVELACRMVCIGKGVQANTDWLDNGEIAVDRGVVVDRFTRTSAPHVYAAGDVAVTYEPITGKPIVTGLWTNAVEMGRCAGANMAGRPTAYGGTFGIMNATQVARTPFVSMGIVHTAGTDYEIHCKSTPTNYRKLVFSPSGDRLVGALFVGDITGAGLYRTVIGGGMEIDALKKQVIDHTLHYGHLLCAKKHGQSTEAG